MDTHPYTMVTEALKKNMVSERLQSFFERKVEQRTAIEDKYVEMLTDWVGDIIIPSHQPEQCEAYLDTDLIRRLLTSLREEGKQHLVCRHQLITNLHELLADIKIASEEGSKKLYEIKSEFETMTEKRSEVKNALFRQRNVKGALQQDNLLTMRMSPDGRGPEWVGARDGLFVDALSQRRSVCEKTVRNLENKLSELDTLNAKDLHYMYTQLEMKENERMGSILLQTKMFLGNLQSCWTPQRSPRPPPSSAHHAGRELRQNLQGLSDTRELLENNWADVIKNAEIQATHSAHVRSVRTAEIQTGKAAELQATRTAQLQARNPAEVPARTVGLQTARNGQPQIARSTELQTPGTAELKTATTAEMHAVELEEVEGMMDSNCMSSSDTALDTTPTIYYSAEPKERPGSCRLSSEYCTDTATKSRLIRCKSAAAPVSAIREDIRATFAPPRPTFIPPPSCTNRNTSSSHKDDKGVTELGDEEEIPCLRKIATVRAIPRQDKDERHASGAGKDSPSDEVNASLSLETLQLPEEVVCERRNGATRENQWFETKTRRKQQRSSTADKPVPAIHPDVSCYTTTNVLPLATTTVLPPASSSSSSSESNANQSHANSSHANPSHNKPSHSNPSHPNPSNANQSHAKPSNTKPSHPSPSHANPSNVNSSHANPSTSGSLVYWSDVLQYCGGVDSSRELVDVSMMTDVSVIAVKNNLHPSNAAELEFKTGQVIHQTASLDENGYCYGYMDSIKLLGRRRLGFYTPDKVTLTKPRKQKRGLNTIFAALQGKHM